MENIIKTTTILEECPWCHKTPFVLKSPLWYGNHGYYGNYEYYVACKNDNCKMRPKTKLYNDLYNMSEQKCIDKSIDDWNTR